MGGDGVWNVGGVAHVDVAFCSYLRSFPLFRRGLSLPGVTIHRVRWRPWIIGLPIAVVLALAALQLRAISRLRAVDEAQLRKVAKDGALGVAWEFNHELARAYDWFAADLSTLEGEVWESFNYEYAAWKDKAPEPDLFRAWYLVTDDGADSLELRLYQPMRGRFARADWPAELLPVRAAIEAENRRRLAGQPHRLAFEPRVGPEWDLPAALLVPLGSVRASPAGSGPVYGYEIGVLDLEHATAELLPRLVRDNLGDADGLHYDVEIALDRDPTHTLLRTGKNLTATRADVDVTLFRIGFAHLSNRLIDADEDGTDHGVWRLRALRHGGGIAAHVARQRRQDLALTAGVVVLLCASLALLLAAARRARRLASQQLTFVAGITHELRTPLAVIRSAAENLADGLVAEPVRVQKYGELLLGEGRRLSHMVEQAIDFAALEAGARSAPQEVYDVAALVEELVRARHADVSMRIASPLPPLKGDPAATRLVLGSLVENARKHAPGAPIAIHVDPVDGLAGQAVRIEVADRGGGIDARDVPHLFEPFYRGRRARAAGARLGAGAVGGQAPHRAATRHDRGALAARAGRQLHRSPTGRAVNPCSPSSVCSSSKTTPVCS